MSDHRYVDIASWVLSGDWSTRIDTVMRQCRCGWFAQSSQMECGPVLDTHYQRHLADIPTGNARIRSGRVRTSQEMH
jgi:hypothetical protein